MPLDVVQTLAELVAVPSVNPMGRDVSGPIYIETRLTAHLERLFDSLSLPWRRQTVAAGRDNIIARLAGDAPGVVLFDAHQDTVPVDGMTIDPFDPIVRGRKLFGRGACDTKGGMAAMLVALSRLAAEPPQGRPTVVMACPVNEEHGFTGARALCELWTSGDEPLLPAAPQAAIVAEPTLLDVVVAHKGVVRWRCMAHGRAAHTSRPEQGDNAIYRIASVIAAIEEYAANVLPREESHPLCGGPTASVSTIQGGISVNTVPDAAVIEIDRRLLPGEDPRRAQRALIEFVAERVGRKGVEHEPPYIVSESLSDAQNRDLAEQVLAAARDIHPECRAIGVPYGTDGAVFAAAGVPTVVFGPGSIDQAHTADEWVDLDQVERASEVYFRFAKGFGRRS
jgi:acetylornithine deacetylase